MKICLWSEFYPPYWGGIEKATQRLAIGMADRGHQVAVITSHYDQPLPDVEQAGNISIYRFPFHAALTTGDLRNTVKSLSGVTALKRKLRPDLMHLQLQAPSSFFHVQTMAAWRAPTLITIHGEFKDCRAGEDTLLGAIFESASWVTAVSHAMLDDLRKVSPKTIPKSSCIYNGGEIVDKAQRTSISEEKIFLAGGRLVYDKGIDQLITAFHQVLVQVPMARLVITGDGPERASLERQAATLGIAQRITFAGWISEHALRQQMERATLMVIPSRWREGFGLYAMEAALLGLPVIATSVGALPELVENGRTGLLVPPEDSVALRDAMLHLLHFPDLRFQIGDAARINAEARFPSSAMLGQYEALYQQLVLP
jgi:glycogen(starch) synthase